MERHILASNSDLRILLHTAPDLYDSGAVRWEKDNPPPFVAHLRKRARSYDEILFLLCEALHGRDNEIAAHAKEDVSNALNSGWSVHPSVVTAIRSCNVPKFGQGFDAGVALAMARYLRDFSLEYTGGDGDDIADLYCFKEKDGPSTFSVHIGHEVWLTHEMKISVPAMPETVQTTWIGRPLCEVVDHPCFDATDKIESYKQSQQFTEITAVKPRDLQAREFSPLKANHEGKNR